MLQDVNVKPLRQIMNAIRVNKSEAEIANMRKAGQASGRVITDTMRRQWSLEKDLWATLDYQFKMSGMEGPAYVPVVAGGKVRRILIQSHSLGDAC